ncbi:MAG: (2Fe-2S)-binding protein [Thermoplasmata archaeon]|nr:(2Fe-2S)-binding protein [Thermoplasmata archaeon]
MKIVCRCEDITEEDIINTIRKYNVQTLVELKQLLRLGMGPCQGRTCLPIAARILAKETGKSVEEIMAPMARPPVIPTPLWLVSEDDEK